MKNNIKETIIGMILIILTVIILNPLDFWMPSMFIMSILIILIAVFGAYAGFILREKSIDERDYAHRALAGRNSFIAGVLFLASGIILQGYYHKVDPWLIITLTVMIVVKMYTRFWSDKNL